MLETTRVLSGGIIAGKALISRNGFFVLTATNVDLRELFLHIGLFADAAGRQRRQFALRLIESLQGDQIANQKNARRCRSRIDLQRLSQQGDCVLWSRTCRGAVDLIEEPRLELRITGRRSPRRIGSADQCAISLVSAADLILRDVDLRLIDRGGGVIRIFLRNSIDSVSRRIEMSFANINRCVGEGRRRVLGVAIADVFEALSRVRVVPGEKKTPGSFEAALDRVGLLAMPARARVDEMFLLS